MVERVSRRRRLMFRVGARLAGRSAAELSMQALLELVNSCFVPTNSDIAGRFRIMLSHLKLQLFINCVNLKRIEIITDSIPLSTPLNISGCRFSTPSPGRNFLSASATTGPPTWARILRETLDSTRGRLGWRVGIDFFKCHCLNCFEVAIVSNVIVSIVSNVIVAIPSEPQKSIRLRRT